MKRALFLTILLCAASANAAEIKSGASSDLLTIDSTSKAARVTLYTPAGVYYGPRASYSAALTAKTATAAGTGPFFSICGSSTKTMRIYYVNVSGTVGTAAVYGDVVLKKTSTATSAGTPVALTIVPLDSTSAAGTASLVNYYSALATAGTLIGAVATKSAVFPITGTVAAQQALVEFAWGQEGMVLRGTAQCLEASFGTTTTNAPTLSMNVQWTEE